MANLPSLFISHGSPMTALNPGIVGERLKALAASIAPPRAIVVASAHFETTSPVVGGASHPATIHDFGGFPQALYEMQYPAPGAPELARHITSLLNEAGLEAHVNPDQGFDHGVWEPLTMLYPKADIPVIPLSIQPHQSPEHHYRMGRALAPLREEGILLIGSGSITHNLRDVFGGHESRDAGYVLPFIQWIEHSLERNDIDALLDYRQQAPFAERAHPTDEHLLPLYFAMGAAGNDTLGAQRIDAGIDAGVLAMDIYRFNGDDVVTLSSGETEV
ncbi:4,5-DOPA dioxygenase extradiol [Halomonadaceae bacterium LMG 33818]|uniref:DODA-type extradiol aromatic ring-opening family dioxygenase n=1 Tax=Cernens ardua TaxID=3402176 RepID=UPI003EDC9624